MERKILSTQRFNIRQITTIGVLSAISIVLGITNLGFIPIPPVNATILHIPVIIGAILEGPLVGAMIGLIFGIFSMIQAISRPNILSFMFLNPIISILPRIAIGIVSYYVYAAIKSNYKTLKIALASIVGSLTNTIGVLGFIYLLYLKDFAAAKEISVAAAKKAILTVGVINGIPEAIISMLIIVPVVKVISLTRIKR